MAINDETMISLSDFHIARSTEGRYICIYHTCIIVCSEVYYNKHRTNYYVCTIICYRI